MSETDSLPEPAVDGVSEGGVLSEDLDDAELADPEPSSGVVSGPSEDAGDA